MMRACNWRRFLALALIPAVLAAVPRPARGASVTFWVSPGGSDAAPGTRAAPFRTLERARAAVREVQDGQRWGIDIVVVLRGGTYRREQPFVLDPQDSGQDGRDVVYRAAPGEHPVLSGAVAVQDWSLQDPGLNIWAAQVGPRHSRQLYVNGQRAIRARTEPYPAGFLPVYFQIFGIPFPVGIEFIPTPLNPARWRDPAAWTNPQDVEAVILTQWKMMSVRLQSLTPYPEYIPDPFNPAFRTGLLTVREPAWTNANVFFSSATGQPGIWSFWQVTRFENAYQFLDEPGEWFLDEHTGWLYYIPRPGEDMATADVELPLLETLVEGRGEPGRPVTNLRFEGLTFSHATWLEPSSDEGYVTDQSGFHLVGPGHAPNIIGHDPNDVPTPGNVRFRFAHAVEFHGNIFEHLGAVGLDFGTGSQGNIVAGNLFADISSAAIQLSGIAGEDHHPTRPEQVSHSNRIADNLVRQAAREFVDAAGVYVGFSRATTLEHNTIVDVPWSAIAVGWGWGLLDPDNFPGLPGAHPGEWGFIQTPTPNRDSVIRANRLHNFVGILWDAGAIYTTGAQGTQMENGLLLEENVATGKRSSGGSNIFYTDGGSRFITLRRNVSLDNPIGVADFGPPPRPGDPLPYSPIPSLGNGVPYGSDSGGCVTYGDIRYVENYWLQTPLPALEAQYNAALFPILGYFAWSPQGFFNICPYTQDGVSYPTRLTYQNNHVINGPQDVPSRILRGAGVRKRPPTIPADRWILPP